MIQEFFMHKTAKNSIDFNAILNDTKQNIVHLLLNFAPFVPPKFLLKRSVTDHLVAAIILSSCKFNNF